MKKISVCIACYNEEKNIRKMYLAIIEQFERLSQYSYEIIFEDNASADGSAEILREIASNDFCVKVIINNRNFGMMRSSKNLIFAANGDCVISLPCDFQEPPEMIPVFIGEWEKGNQIVWGQKVKSRENRFRFFLRSIFYKIIKRMSDVPQYEHVTGFGLMDRKIVDEVRKIDEPDMLLRHIIADLGYPIKLVPYTQEKRKAGKSSFNLWRYLDFSINSLIRTSTKPLRLTTVFGAICAGLSFIFGIIYFIYKLIYWNVFSAGIAPIVIAMFFLGSVQLLCIGVIGEYLSVVLKKLTKRPYVTEKERINFDDKEC